MLPSPTLIGLVALVGLLLLAALLVSPAAHGGPRAAAVLAATLVALVLIDAGLSMRAWRKAPLLLDRRLPLAMAIGVAAKLVIVLENPGRTRRRGRLLDGAERASLVAAAPLRFEVPPGAHLRLEFPLVPAARGLQRLRPARIFLRSVLGLLDLDLRLGGEQQRRVFCDFRRQAAFARMPRGRCLADLGLRGAGAGADAADVERGQSVMLMLDCGQGMRAEGGRATAGPAAFDRVLEALMLFAAFALREGDAVGACTFAAAPGAERHVAPRAGRGMQELLMAQLADVEPTGPLPDYSRAARDLMRGLRTRGLVVLVTRFPDEGFEGLSTALRLLGSRHRVLVADVREAVVARIASQPLSRPLAVLEVASALEYDQRRRDLHRRLAMQGAVLVDCEPHALAAGLVGRYQELKRTARI